MFHFFSTFSTSSFWCILISLLKLNMKKKSEKIADKHKFIVHEAKTRTFKKKFKTVLQNHAAKFLRWNKLELEIQ